MHRLRLNHKVRPADAHAKKSYHRTIAKSVVMGSDADGFIRGEHARVRASAPPDSWRS